MQEWIIVLNSVVYYYVYTTLLSTIFYEIDVMLNKNSLSLVTGGNERKYFTHMAVSPTRSHLLWYGYDKSVERMLRSSDSSVLNKKDTDDT